MPGKVVTRLTSGNDIHVISSSFYGTCSTAENTRVKEVVINNPNINKITLVTGMLLSVKFVNSNTATNPALEILDNKGTTTLTNVISLTCYGNTRPGTAPNTSWIAGSVVTFVYDGLYWVETSGWDTFSFSGGTVNGSITATGRIVGWGLTSTNEVIFKNTNLTDGTAVSGTVNGSSQVSFLDSAGSLIGRLLSQFEGSTQYLYQYVQRTVNGSVKRNGLALGLDVSGNPTVYINAPATWRTALGLGTLATKNSLTTSDIPALAYLPTSGGTVTGSIINKISSLTRGTTPSANTYRTYEFTDKDNKRLGMLEFGSLTDDRNVVQLRILGNYASGDAYGGIVIEKTKGNTGNANMTYNANTGALSGFTCSAAVLTSGTVARARIENTAWTYLVGSASTVASGNFVRWRMVAGIVFLQVYYRSGAGLTAGSSKLIGNISANYRPSSSVESTGYLGAGNTSPCDIWIESNGNVYIIAATAASSKFYGTLSYPLG